LHVSIKKHPKASLTLNSGNIWLIGPQASDWANEYPRVDNERRAALCQRRCSRTPAQLVTLASKAILFTFQRGWFLRRLSCWNPISKYNVVGPGFFPLPDRLKRRGPVSVYRTGSTGNRPNPNEFKFQIKISSPLGLVRFRPGTGR
jgi:hypothetical protein